MPAASFRLALLRVGRPRSLRTAIAANKGVLRLRTSKTRLCCVRMTLHNIFSCHPERSGPQRFSDSLRCESGGRESATAMAAKKEVLHSARAKPAMRLGLHFITFSAVILSAGPATFFRLALLRVGRPRSRRTAMAATKGSFDSARAKPARAALRMTLHNIFSCHPERSGRSAFSDSLFCESGGHEVEGPLSPQTKGSFDSARAKPARAALRMTLHNIFSCHPERSGRSAFPTRSFASRAATKSKDPYGREERGPSTPHEQNPLVLRSG